jgi:hypothetical protein
VQQQVDRICRHGSRQAWQQMLKQAAYASATSSRETQCAGMRIHLCFHWFPALTPCTVSQHCTHNRLSSIQLNLDGVRAHEPPPFMLLWTLRCVAPLHSQCPDNRLSSGSLKLVPTSPGPGPTCHVIVDIELCRTALAMH